MKPLPAAEWEALSEIAQATAGARGRMVLRALEGKAFYDGFAVRSGLHFDERTLRIEKVVYGRYRCPYVLAHEFGHAYHCYHWPVLSALMQVPCARAEAVAYLFELELHAVAERRYVGNPPNGLPHFSYLSTSTWQSRRKDLRAERKRWPEPFDILDALMHNPPKDFHALVGRIVEGA